MAAEDLQEGRIRSDGLVNDSAEGLGFQSNLGLQFRTSVPLDEFPGSALVLGSLGDHQRVSGNSSGALAILAHGSGSSSPVLQHFRNSLSGIHEIGVKHGSIIEHSQLALLEHGNGVSVGHVTATDRTVLIDQISKLLNGSLGFSTIQHRIAFCVHILTTVSVQEGSPDIHVQAFTSTGTQAQRSDAFQSGELFAGGFNFSPSLGSFSNADLFEQVLAVEQHGGLTDAGQTVNAVFDLQQISISVDVIAVVEGSIVGNVIVQGLDPAGHVITGNLGAVDQHDIVSTGVGAQFHLLLGSQGDALDVFDVNLDTGSGFEFGDELVRYVVVVMGVQNNVDRRSRIGLVRFGECSHGEQQAKNQSQGQDLRQFHNS